MASRTVRIFLWGQGSLQGEFKSADKSVFSLSLEEEAGKLFMGFRGSIHFNVILIDFFEEIHQNPHVDLDLVISV